MLSTTLRKRYNALLKTLQAYEAAVNESAIVSITDLEGRIVYVNDKFIEISKYTAEELIGNTHRLVNSGYHPDAFFKEMWQTISTGGHWRGEIRNRAKDGTYYWVDTVITPVRDHKENIFQYLSVRNLITSKKENEEKLSSYQAVLLKRKEQLKAAQKIAKTGSWHFDIPGNELEWSEETYRIFGIPAGTPMTYESFLEKVHPDDRMLVHDTWLEAQKKGGYALEHRIITTEGEKWVSEHARLSFDAASAVIHADGTVQDITEKKKTEDILRESESLYKNLFNSSPNAIGIVDRETMRFLEVNETGVNLYGYSREEFRQLTIFDIRKEEEHEQVKAQISGGTYTGDKAVRMHKRKDGSIIRVEPLISEINYRGKQALLITINDVTEKLKMEEELASEKVNKQKEISRASLDAEDKSRGDIGRELHDNINQLLIASTLYLRNLKLDPEHSRERIDKSLEIIFSAIKEIRKLSSTLVPPSLNDLTLKQSIEELWENFELNNIAVDYDIIIDEDSMEEGLKINIYRIIQEQFNNIIKYAHAHKVQIRLIQDEHGIVLEINDDGAGFDQQQKPRGIGLTNISHRAEAYNGKVCIDSSPGKGCRLRVDFTWPVFLRGAPAPIPTP